MSGQRFDELTKLVAAGSSSRRSFLKGLVAAAAGTSYGLTAPGNARAHHEGGELCRDNDALCRSNADCCNVPPVRCTAGDPGVEFPTCVLD